MCQGLGGHTHPTTAEFQTSRPGTLHTQSRESADLLPRSTRYSLLRASCLCLLMSTPYSSLIASLTSPTRSLPPPRYLSGQASSLVLLRWRRPIPQDITQDGGCPARSLGGNSARSLQSMTSCRLAGNWLSPKCQGFISSKCQGFLSPKCQGFTTSQR